jgi:processive 1,2-diacylglycerol beta-glucosyltransferase
MAYARSYLEVTDHAPLVWGYYYTITNDDPDMADIVNNIRKLVEGVSTTDLKDLIQEFVPDVIICTHFLPMEILVRLKNKARLPQPVYCVITDHVAHTFWTYTNIDGYFVGSPIVREQLIERGVAPSRICVTGIPVNPKIAEPKDPATERQQLKLPADRPVVTLFGGGVSDESVRKIIEGILESETPGVLNVVAGRNESLLEAIDDLQSSNTIELRVLGFINYVDSLVAASDLVITKAGGLIISEVLARSVPLVIIEPTLGHEEWNADFVVNSGAGVQLRVADSVPASVRRLLSKPHILEELRASAGAAGLANAACDIADRVIAELARR